MPYQSTHCLYTIENLPMNFFRESQTSTNTSKFKHLQYRREIAWSLNHCRRFTVEKAWFSKYVTSFSIDFRNIYIVLKAATVVCRSARSNSWLCPFKLMWNLWAWTKLHSTKMQVKKPTECRLIKFFFLAIGWNNLVLFCTKMKLHFQTSSFS